MFLHCIVKDLALTLQSQNFLSIYVCPDYVACDFACSKCFHTDGDADPCDFWEELPVGLSVWDKVILY